MGAFGYILGVVGLASIFAKFLPALEHLKTLKEAADVYFTFVREPLRAWLVVPGAAHGAFDALLDLLIVWIALFLAVNAFTRRVDGLYLWGHVTRRHCFAAPRGIVGKLTCALPRYAIAVLMLPIVFLIGAGSLAVTRSEYLTMCFVTIKTKDVATYLLGLITLSALVVGTPLALDTALNLIRHANS